MATVTGPASSTDTAIARWDGTSGTLIQDSAVTIDGSGNVTGVASLAGSVTTTTQTQGDNSTSIATTAYVDTGLSHLSLDSLLDCAADGQSIAVGRNTVAGASNAVSVGYGAGAISGTDNTAVGVECLGGSGDSNTAIGFGALSTVSVTKNENVAVGREALLSCASDNNVAIGYEAGQTLTTGSDNIYIGHSVDVLSGATDSHTINIGNVFAVTGTGTPSTSQTTIAGDFIVTGTITGTSTTQSPGDNSTKIATTAYVDRAAGAAVAYNAISGNLPSSMTGTHTTASMTISAGQAANSTNAVYITGAGYSWAVSNGNAINGYQGGSTLPNSSTIHMYLCTGASGTGVFASTSLTPTLPTGYAVSYRRIFSFQTNGSGAPLPYTAVEVEGGAMIAWLATQVLDVSLSTLGSASRTLYTLSIPSGVKMQALIRQVSGTSNSNILFTSPDETDVAPGTLSTVPLMDGNNSNVAFTGQPYLITNTSSQIGARASTTSVNLEVATRGWKDFRRG